MLIPRKVEIRPPNLAIQRMEDRKPNPKREDAADTHNF